MDDTIKTKLKDLGLDDVQIEKLNQAGANVEADLALLTAEDIVATTNCGIVTARKVVAAFAPVAAEVTAPAMSPESFNLVLPMVPDDESWLKALRAGGVLKVEQSTVISTIRAALADRGGLYGVPDKLAKAMEAYTDETEEQVDPSFYKLLKMLTRTEYGDLFAAIPGMDGNFATKTRKAELLRRIDEHLWTAVIDFNSQLQAWQQAWMNGAANPMVMMAAMMGSRSGGLPPGMMQPPDTGVLRDAAETVNDQINRIFRGTGVQIAAALAYDANRIKEVLQQDGLPATIGTPNREQMLKKLGVSVSASYPRLETNLTQFVLGIMKAADQPAGEEELRYWSALYMLGMQINLEQLAGRSGPGRAGLGRSGEL